MCVCLFGCRSSPPGNKYELAMKYVDGKHQFGEAGAEILQNNFYVDNM